MLVVVVVVVMVVVVVVVVLVVYCVGMMPGMVGWAVLDCPSTNHRAAVAVLPTCVV